jgi:hypothetical protein
LVEATRRQHGLRTVRLVFTKWDGRLHWHFFLRRLGEDEHGVWLAVPAGTPYQRGYEEPLIESDGFLVLIPSTGSWAALWNLKKEPEIYVDVTSPPEWSDGVVTAVDLDLDVVRYRDGRVRVLDRDEFAEHRALMAYPQTVVDGAEATARWLTEAMAARREPFGDASGRWLAGVNA